MITEQFTIVMGVTPGYHHENQNADTVFARRVMRVADEVFANTGVYLSAVITPAVVTYRTEWGCPETGEKVYQLTGVRNNKFIPDAAEWNRAVHMFASELRREFAQTTASLTFTDVDFHYVQRPPVTVESLLDRKAE
jgi:hypothetical protein